MSEHDRLRNQAGLDRAIQNRIGRELRVVFAAPLHQPLPDKLLGALRAIQDAEKGLNRSEGPAAMRLGELLPL